MDRDRFEALVDFANASLQSGEVLLTGLDGEDSDFVRFNGDSVRQAGSVSQRSVSLDLIEGRRHAAGEVTLSGDDDVDRARVSRMLEELREQRRLLPEDPFLLYATEGPSTERDTGGRPLTGGDAVGRVLDASSGRDLAGLYAAGSTYSGFASSLGQRHWHQGATFNLDWSFYLHGDKAAKGLYAGSAWDDDAFAAKVEWAGRQLEALARPPIDLAPDGYRTYLAPAAMQEWMEVLSWSGAFGMKSHRTKRTPFLRMETEGATLHPEIRMSEDVGRGVAPGFQGQGFVKPDEVVLIEGGKLAGHLVSPRSAQEYGLATNGAESFEAPLSLSLAPGSLPTKDVLAELGTGLFVGNLWYMNFSDRAACRATGMTRFATFWVEDGEVVAPVNVLRFDDTAYRLLGERLVGLTDTADVILDPSSYGARSRVSYSLPGVLVEEMRFTL